MQGMEPGGKYLGSPLPGFTDSPVLRAKSIISPSLGERLQERARKRDERNHRMCRIEFCLLMSFMGKAILCEDGEGCKCVFVLVGGAFRGTSITRLIV